MNGLRKLVMRIFPPPHRRVRWQAGVPLFAFALIMGLICFSIVPFIAIAFCLNFSDE